MARQDTLTLRLTPIEREDLAAQAKAEGRSIGDVARRRMFPVIPAGGAGGAGSAILFDPSPVKKKAGAGAAIDISRPMTNTGTALPAFCDHAGTEIGKLSGVGVCDRCGKTVTKKEVGG